MYVFVCKIVEEQSSALKGTGSSLPEHFTGATPTYSIAITK